MEKFPIFKACFSANGEEVLATSTHSKVLYVYDMLAGKLIPVHQVRGKVSMEYIDTRSPQLSLLNSIYNHFSFSYDKILKNRVSLVLVCGERVVEIMCLNEKSELTLLGGVKHMWGKKS